MRPTATKWILIAAALFVAVGLALPALQPPRRTTPGIRCASNLRQIGLGLLAYLNSKNQFPPGTVANPDLPLAGRLGWGSTILYYIDMVGCFEEKGTTPEAASRLAWDDPVFSGLISEPGITRCPEARPGWSYLGIAGLGPDAPGLPVEHPRAGIFGDDRRVRPADVKDGLARTMMVVESAATPGPWIAGGRATVAGVDPAQRPHVGPGRPFGGLHPDRTNVLMADGSIRSVSPRTSPAAFEAMSTIAGSEAVPDPDDSP